MMHWKPRGWLRAGMLLAVMLALGLAGGAQGNNDAGGGYDLPRGWIGSVGNGSNQLAGVFDRGRTVGVWGQHFGNDRDRRRA